MDNRDKRTRKPEALKDAIEHAKGELEDAMPASFGWTDEQWAAHDARIAAERAEQAPVVEVRAAPPPDLIALGWEPRHVAAAALDRSSQAVRVVLEHDFSKRNVLILSGLTGCGKTTAAARWARDRRGVRCVRAARFATSSRYTSEERTAWMTSPGLCLDDLGAEYIDEKGSFLVDLDELIDTFYASMRPLVITTNLLLDALKKRYRARIADRLRECARFVSISEPSMRGRDR